jgi:diadenosine tetraphosphatase ApaH/serine/threonine PP2A family protein phosphatase
VDAIVFGGDVASGPFPVETLALVRSLDAYSILGNGDRPFRERPEAAWVWDQHSEEEIAWLGALPERLVLGNTLFVHATPRSIEEIVTPLTPDERLAEILDGVEQEVVVGGHTHMQQDRRVGRWRFVNAGSVGMPYEDGPGAYWAIVDDGVELRRTDYDLGAAAEAIRASGWPIAEEFAAENILQVPSREEAATLFERMATEGAEA